MMLVIAGKRLEESKRLVQVILCCRDNWLEGALAIEYHVAFFVMVSN